LRQQKKLKPKVVISENVSGLIKGKARGYVKQIFKQFDMAGYSTQFFLLNAAFMGVPQKRERVFFISTRKDLLLPKIKLSFSENPIPFSEIEEKINGTPAELAMTPLMKYYWGLCAAGKYFSSVHPRKSFFNFYKISKDIPLCTLTSSSGDKVFHYETPRKLSDKEWLNGQTFPLDFKCKKTVLRYAIGMSVPPFMMKKISEQVMEQLLKTKQGGASFDQVDSQA
jgi:DNA (cytosine-5)-methyltransferase 1